MDILHSPSPQSLLLAVKLRKSYLILLTLINNMVRSLLHRAGQFLLGREGWLLSLANLNLKRMKGMRYEQSFRHFVKLLPLKGMVLDIGANLGVMSVYLAQKNSTWKIVAVEPIPLHVSVMKRLFKHQHTEKIEVVAKAVSNQSGVLQMHIPIQHGSVQHGLAKVIGNEEGNKQEIYAVQAITIDELMQAYQQEVLVGIKMDVENHEWEALNGALQSIRTYRPILLIELWKDEKKQKCMNLLESLDYRVMVMNDKALLVSYTNQDALDYFFIPKEMSV